MVSTIDNGNNSTTLQKYSWEDFVSILSKKTFTYPGIRIAYLAQCILESGSGTSKLFREAGNPTGIKWRPEMELVAAKVWLETPTEPEGTFWCAWDTPEAAIQGYLKFIARKRYLGWEKFGSDPVGYINHLVQHGYATDPSYVNKVASLFSRAEQLLSISTNNALHDSEVATWFNIDLAPDKEPVIYAMAENVRLSSLKSTSSQEVCDYLLKHQGARTVRLSQQIKVLNDSELTHISKNINPQATWFQFWRTAGSETALLGMQAGHAVDALVSKSKNDIVKFLKAHPKALTVQAANLNSPPLQALKSISINHTTRAASLKPSIKWVPGCRNFSSRNGQAVDSIVLHYTTSRNVNGTISWFNDPASEVSAHYIVDRDGKIYQQVKDSDKAWHCYGFNTSSIGIEHVAEKGDRLTKAQEEASAALIRWLASEYEISAEQIFGHRWNPKEPGSTSCPGSLWSSQEELHTWLEQKVYASARPVVGDRSVATTAHLRQGKDLDVPYFKQLDNSYNPSGACNVTSVAMCLHFLGIRGDGSEKQLEDQMYQRCIANHWSRHTPQGLKRLIESYPGIKDNLTTSGSLADIRKALDEGNPCIVHGFFTGFGHILVIRGYNQQDFLVNDPFGEWFPSGYKTELTGEKRKYSKRAIAACCHAWSQGEALDLYARMSDGQIESLKQMWLHRVHKV